MPFKTTRVFIFPDIHGNFQEFKELLKIIPYSPKDSFIVFLGDYIDRGPETKEVVDTVIKLVKTGQAVALRGNHEQMMIDAYKKPYTHYSNFPLETWLCNGGKATLASIKDRDILEEYLKFFEKLPVIYETKNYVFVHAGLRPGFPLHRQFEEDVLWIREDWIKGESPEDRIVVFGHTPTHYIGSEKAMLLNKNKIALDTGSGNKKGHLSVLEVPAGVVYTTRGTYTLFAKEQDNSQAN